MDAKKIKEELIRQKSSNFKGNIYYKTQISFAYNSNKIEGSKLTKIKPKQFLIHIVSFQKLTT